MKKLILICATVSLVTGCTSLLKTNVATVPVVQTNYVVQTAFTIQTNLVTVTQTNGVILTNAVAVTNTLAVTNQAFVTNLVSQTNFNVSSGAQAALATISAANTVTGPLNPFSGWITLALTATTAGLGWFAKIKSQQAASHASVAATVIQAVEAAPTDVGNLVKGIVSDLSVKKGIYQTVDDAVQNITG